MSVPIGCPDDISARAVRILQTVPKILYENISVSRKLIEQLGVTGCLSRYPCGTTDRQCRSVLEPLQAGIDVALICDAGTPGIADTGQRLIRAAVQNRIPVVAVPGPTALMVALIASGLPTDRFVFDGFPPRDAALRHGFFDRLAREERTLVLYESANYLRATLTALCERVGPWRRIAVACRLTRPSETWFRGQVGEAIAHFQERRPRGEFTLVMEGHAPKE